MIDLDKIKQLYKFGKHLSLTDINDLLKAAKSQSFEKKEFILREGSIQKDIYFVRKGLIRQYIIHENGEETTFRFIPENTVMVNVDIILFDQPSRFHFEALEKTKTLSIDQAVADAIISKNPKLQANRIQFAQKLMKEMHRRIELFVLHTPEERYLHFIKEYPNINDRVPDKYIANVLGMTPVSLSRIRARIAEKS